VCSGRHDTVREENRTAEVIVRVDERAYAASAPHQLIAGLVEELPPVGADFPAEKRENWLNAARLIFSLLYGTTPVNEESAMNQHAPRNEVKGVNL
jgi:hypothetical protein